MAPSTLLIREATESTIDRIVAIQFSAFEGDPYQEALFPGDYHSAALRRSASERTLKYFRSDDSARWLVCSDASHEFPDSAEAVLGFALWNVYAQPREESEWRRPVEVDWCTGRAREIATNFLSMNARLRQRMWEGRPYVLLNLLCVHRDWQGRGAGTALVRWGMEMADGLGLPIHIEASPAGFRLYKKLGFRQVEVAVVRAEEWDGDHDREYVAMVREPRMVEGEGEVSARKEG